MGKHGVQGVASKTIKEHAVTSELESEEWQGYQSLAKFLQNASQKSVEPRPLRKEKKVAALGRRRSYRW